MSEVDRVSHSGLYPALPIADKHPGRDPSAGRPPPGNQSAPTPPTADRDADSNLPRAPKSIIDEYA